MKSKKGTQRLEDAETNNESPKRRFSPFVTKKKEENSKSKLTEEKEEEQVSKIAVITAKGGQGRG